ncbi:MAG: class I SAM-dependent methyltransferase [Deltaproteobacteria bacterium]|nr:class I SAM-dependent methyltransferase [Deltaproteobacteria bacterium]
MSTPLHAQAPTQRFSDRVADYVKHRPGYPREVWECVLGGFPLDSVVVADIGAGTGISSRGLAELLSGTARVIAVEPNADMRKGAAPDPRVEWHDGTGEATRLPDASVDVIVCAQAFHWMRKDEALAEFKRVLKPGGRVALVWNDRDERDAATRRYGELILVASQKHAAAQRFDQFVALRESPLFTKFRNVDFQSGQDLDRDGLLGRARSASYIPHEGPLWDALEAGLTQLVRDFADVRGHVRLVYTAHVYLAEVPK